MVELFYDLVFVFAITQLSHGLLAHLDPMGALRRTHACGAVGAEAIGREPERPARFAGIEDLPRVVVPLPNDVGALKALIAERVPA